MSEQTLYIRRTKGGHVMPPITLDEMLALVAAKGVDAGDDLKVVGIRSFASNETWAPVRDYPEFAEFFDSGRKLAMAEAGRARRSWSYAAVAILGCLVVIFFFWWKPYVDAQDAVGEVGRLKRQLSDEKVRAASTEKDLRERAEKISRQNDALEAKNGSLLADLAKFRKRLDEANKDAEDSASSAAALANSEKKLLSEIERLESRLSKLNDLPKFWPGGEALQAPESEEEVRLVSVLPENGYLYVIGLRSYPADSIVTLDQPGFLGVKIVAKVVNSYPHAGGEKGMSLHVPDVTAVDSSKIRKLKLGEVLNCSAFNSK